MGSKSRNLALFLTLLFALSTVLLPCSTVKAQTRTIVVPDDYSDIQTAINHANDGDTVFVKAGTYIYNEQNTTLARPHSGNPDYGIMVNKSISLTGENKNTIISMNYNGGIAVCVQADGVTFSGFTVTSNIWSTKYGDVSSLDFWGSNCLITNNDFQRTVVGTGKNENISYNNFEGADNFGVVVTLHNSIISHNNISDNYLGGIDISDSARVTIEENDINGNGVDYYGPHPLEYDGAGISLTTYSQNVNSNISIYHNNITDNARFGIQFNGATSNSSISNNNITNNGVGINLSNLGLRSYSAIGNQTKIFYNNIIGNAKNAYVEKEYPYNLTSDMLYSRVNGNATDIVSWDNGVAGNYWGDYNGNGSYVIDENNIDHYPLTQQVAVNSIAPTPTPSSMISNFNSSLVFVIIAVVVIFVLAVSLLLSRRHRKTVNVTQ
jgi:parallel beta-helix repeat protein